MKHKAKSSDRSLKVELLESRRVLATLLVNSASDGASPSNASDLDDGNLTLREAVRIVNGDYEPTSINGDPTQIDDFSTIGTNDIIKFDPEVFGNGQLFPGVDREDTIELIHGELVVGNSVIIDGNASSLVDFGDGNGPVPVAGPGWQGLTIDASGFILDTGGGSPITGRNTDSTIGDGERIFDLVAQTDEHMTIRGMSLTGGDASRL